MQTTATPRASKVKPNMGCAYALAWIIAGFAVLLLFKAWTLYPGDGQKIPPAVVITSLVGLALLAAMPPYLRYARRLVAESEAEEARRMQFPGQPWKWKKKWLAPAIEADSGSSAALMWFFAIFWNTLSMPAAWFVLHDPHTKKGAYVIFLFPLIGLGLFVSAIYQTARWRKFGCSRFVPSTMPGAIGGYLGGMIEVPARVVPDGDARLALKCIRRETRGSGKSRSTTESILWEHEVRIARDKWLTGLGGTQIPVLFYIPAGCSGTDDSDSDNEVLWRLSAAAAVPGVDFSVRFVVPVFATGETAPAPEAGHPLLEAYSGEDLDNEALRRCGVRHEGNTFYFSASHLPGTRFMTAVLTLGLIGLLGWFWGRGIHPIAWVVATMFLLAISLFALDVWCDRFELRMEGDSVEVTKRRPWGTKITRVLRTEVQRVRSEKGMSLGENQYYRLSLIGTQGMDDSQTQADEPFRVRKLRYQLEQLKKEGRATPGQIKELSGEIMVELRSQPKFIIKFAKHIPGQAKAEAIGAQILAVIKGSAF